MKQPWRNSGGSRRNLGGAIGRFGDAESWVWLKETPEQLARMVSRQCALDSFANLRLVGDRIVHDAVKAGDMRAVTAALYEHLHAERLDYAGPAYLADGSHSQQVRSPADIQTGRQATCLDLTLLFSSLALDLGLRPIIVILEGERVGHSLVVVKTTEASLTVDRSFNRKTLDDWLERGRLVAVETTGLAQGAGLDLDFDTAETNARARIAAMDFVAAVDPQRLHGERGFREYRCRAPERRRSRIVRSALLSAVIVLLFGGVTRTAADPTEFADTETGIVVLPSIEDGLAKRTTSALTELFDERLGIAMATDDAVLQDYPLADNLGGRALTDTAEVVRDGKIAQLIVQTNASVVISPVLRRDRNLVLVELEAWLGNLDGAEELVGQRLDFLFCNPPPSVRMLQLDQGSVAQLDDLAGQTMSSLLPRIEDLLGAVASQRGFDYPAARDRLTTVIDATESGDCDNVAGTALLHHLRGNVHLDLAGYVSATTDYDRALELDGDFLRSLLGLAEVELLSALGDGCGPSTINRINTALERYEDFSMSPITQADATLSAKADIGQGRALSCAARAQTALGLDSSSTFDAALEHFDLGLSRFETVTAARSPSGDLLTESAAVGYMERGDLRLLLYRMDEPANLSEAQAEIWDDLGRAVTWTLRPWVEAAVEYRAVEACETFGDDDCDDIRLRACSLITESRTILAESESAVLTSLAGQESDLDCST